MTRIKVDSKTAFQDGIERRLGGQQGNEALIEFSRQFFAQVPLSELLTREWEYAEAVLLDNWHFFKSFTGRAKVRVFSPTLQANGYEHRKAIVEVVSKSLPFLLDSIRIELSRHGIGLADVQQCLLSVVRGRDRLVINNDGEANETLIHLEIDRPGDFKQTEKRLREVIRLVQRVVDDFAPMRRQLLLWSDEFGVTSGRGDLLEGYDALQWIYANNFTFLGYEELEKAKDGYEVIEGSELGLARKGFYAHGQQLVDPGDELVSYSKSSLKSRVHRPAYFDEITVISPRERNRACRFYGLFTSGVFNQNPIDIPVVGRKVTHVFEEMGLSPFSHTGREVSRIIEILPREELFLSTREQLAETVEKIYALQERRIVRVLVRIDRNGHFVNCLVYTPRDTYDTELRLKTQELLVQQFNAHSADFYTFFSESALVRTHFILRVDPDQRINVDIDHLESVISDYTRNWEDDLRSILLAEFGEDEGEQTYQQVAGVFPPGYKDDYWPATACGDIEFILNLTEDEPLKVCLYQWRIGDRVETRFKLFSRETALPLSDVIPILENLGARAIEEHPYELRLNGQRVWLHDFVLELQDVGQEASELKMHFEDAFLQTWYGDKENDSFNRLVTSANMTARQVWVLRAYARYLGQLGVGASQGYIADCMRRYSDIAHTFLSLFELRFDPDGERKSVGAGVKRLHREALEKIEQVENLSDDRILRAYIETILATLRTNYYQLDEDGNPKEYLSLKLQPELISEAPLPKPKYEMFVYSCRVEGVHLRGGKVARGGLRWSDRSEDYRTEVLGLMKAQQVKNSVIVPLGAKGGFLPKRSMEGASREEVMAEGVYCYRMFIRGLLDVADNLVKGKVVHPERVVRYDDDDYYLVVAADKGTATFSDIANEVAESYGFWLGDAFASGGSNGYDHKQMGITAKGAWESVKRHFRDKHIDTQAEDFSVVAIGDMAGDVFGNGMLLSKHIQLVAAFNHLHIFVDPSPSAAKSYRERKRLFELERSSWADYNPRLISEGGGVFSRSAKSIAISPEMKKRFDIRESSLTPNGLISYLLKAEVDLLWNGGIGTYVKSRLESDLVVGDKANDAIRINGDELRCKVVGEGGNLGLTQLGRVEFNLNGGVCFTDFIDNAGGVNSSDAEVNIKIMLNQLMESGKLSDRSRKTLLAQMTDEVSELVLENNYRQAQAINLMQHQAVRRNFEYIRVMKGLEEHGYLNPRIEFLPTEEEVQERLTSGQALTAPELSVLTSYVKGAVKERLAEESFEDPYFLKEMYTAFPPTLVKKFGRQLEKHRLKREIIATQIANNMVNNMGMSFVSRIQETTGASRSQIASAYLAARDIFGMEDRLSEIRSLDGKVKPDIQIDMIQDLIRLVRRGTRWLLRNRRDTLDLGKDVPLFQKPLATLQRDFSAIGAGDAINEWRSGTKRLSREGVPAELAGFIAASHHLYSLMGIVEVSRLTGETTSRVASVQFAVGDQLHLHWFSKQMHEYQAASQWEALARESLQDDLNWQQVAITMAVLSEGKKRAPAERLITHWMEEHNDLVQRWLSMQAEIRSSTVRDLSIYTVAIRELMDLSQSTLGTSARIGFGT